jgi:hypothetical protein
MKNLAESSKECYGSKRAVLPMIMMMIMKIMMMATTTILVYIFRFMVWNIYVFIEVHADV